MIKLYFDDNTTFNLKDNCEEEVLKQMKKPKEKRLYIYGVDFSRVKRVEIILK